MRTGGAAGAAATLPHGRLGVSAATRPGGSATDWTRPHGRGRIPRTVGARYLRIVALLLLSAGCPVAALRAAQQAPAAPRLPVLVTVKAIRSLSQDEGARGYPVRVRAIVTPSMS